MMQLRPDRAIMELTKLRDEGRSPALAQDKLAFDTWRSKVRGVLIDAFGEDDQAVKTFTGIRFFPNGIKRNTPDIHWVVARAEGIDRACAELDAIVHRLKLRSNWDDLIDETSFDSELWAHVATLVTDQDWPKVAAQAAIFVEDRLRRWTRAPKDKKGDALYGRALYANVLGTGGVYQLGSRTGESEGWLMLGMGFAQALGNVDRHNIQDRTDARRYAIGVLGVASLLLTQLRYEHADLIVAADATPGERA